MFSAESVPFVWESPFITGSDTPIPTDPRCEECDCSMVDRWGGSATTQHCESCEADAELFHQARGGAIEVVDSIPSALKEAA